MNRTCKVAERNDRSRAFWKKKMTEFSSTIFELTANLIIMVKPQFRYYACDVQRLNQVLLFISLGNKSVHIYNINVGERMKDGKFLSSVRRMWKWIISMSRAWDREKIWVPDRIRTYDLQFSLSHARDMLISLFHNINVAFHSLAT